MYRIIQFCSRIAPGRLLNGEFYAQKLHSLYRIFPVKVKARQSNNCITSLKDENGCTKASDMDVLSIAHSFYQNLYTSSQTEDKAIDSYLGSLNTEQTLSDLEKDSCEGGITLDECTLAVSKMKINKSPGLDGICIEFYKKIWPVVGKLLVYVFNDSYAEGILPDSERTVTSSNDINIQERRRR